LQSRGEMDHLIRRIFVARRSFARREERKLGFVTKLTVDDVEKRLMTVVHCKVGVVGLPGYLFPVTGEMGKGMGAQGR